ncbi:MAG: MATE family efflux transporter [Clostridia bacterium]
MTRSIDTTQGSLRAGLIRLSWPIMVTNLINIIYNLTDTYFVGQLSYSREAIGAVSVTFNVMFLLVAVAIGLAMGTSTLVSQYFGAKDYKNIRHTAYTSLILIGVIALVISVLSIIFRDNIFRLLQTSEDILPYAREYFTIIMSGMMFMFFFFVISSILRGVGDTKTPMIAGIISGLMNAVLDPFLIYGWWIFPELGVSGAAYATVFSRFLVTLYLLWYVFKKNSPLAFKIKDMRVDLDIAKKIFKIGIPSSLSELMVAVGATLILARVNTFGAAATAAYGLGTRMDSFLYLPTMGIGQATATIVGQNLGAGNRDRAYRSGIQAMVSSFVFVLLVGLLLAFFARPILSLFTPDAEVVELGRFYIYFVGLAFCFIAVRVAVLFSFIGAGATKLAMFSTFITLILIRVPLAYLFSYTSLGLNGVFLGIGVAFVISAGFMTWLYSRKKWMDSVVVRPPATPAPL